MESLRFREVIGLTQVNQQFSVQIREEDSFTEFLPYEHSGGTRGLIFSRQVWTGDTEIPIREPSAHKLPHFIPTTTLGGSG